MIDPLDALTPRMADALRLALVHIPFNNYEARVAIRVALIRAGEPMIAPLDSLAYDNAAPYDAKGNTP